jgi:hypothetical protein
MPRESSFTYPQAAADRILEQLQRLKSSPAAFSDGPAGGDDGARLAHVPPARRFGELLETAFFATLTETESRSTRFELAYVPVEEVVDRGWSHVSFDPVPLTVDSLRHLATATDPALSMIGTFHDSDGLFMWGVMPNTFGQEPALPALRIAGRTAGHLDISVPSRRVASLMGGRLLLYDTYLSETQLYSFAETLFVDQQVVRPSPEALLALLEIAREIVDIGHGGTMLIVGHNRLDEIPALQVPSTYRVRRPVQILPGETAGQATASSHRTSSAGSTPTGTGSTKRHSSARLDDRRLSREAIRIVANLASMDGAVVLTTNLELLAFGVLIDTAPSASPVTLPTLDPSRPDTRATRTPQEFGGSRHQSAIAFCRAQTNAALAIVVSRDSTVSAFLRDASGVLAIRPLDVGLARFGAQI